MVKKVTQSPNEFGRGNHTDLTVRSGDAVEAKPFLPTRHHPDIQRASYYIDRSTDPPLGRGEH